MSEENDFPVAWRPEPGDTVRGELVNVEVIDPNGNGLYPVLTLKASDGDRAIHAFHSVLRKELARLNGGTGPKVGDELTILYQGKKDLSNPKPGRPAQYHAYRVSGGDGASYDWGAEIGGGGSQPPAAPAAQAVVEPERQSASEQFGDAPPF